jgi:hypothetical protein
MGDEANDFTCFGVTCHHQLVQREVSQVELSTLVSYETGVGIDQILASLTATIT